MAESTITPSKTTETAPPVREETREDERYLTPAVDIFETKDGLTVVADMPGLAPDALRLNVNDDVLTIEGRIAAAANGTNAVSREFELASYFRQFTLGGKIDQGRIGAEYKHGVLTLTLPLAEAAKPRQIQVATAN